MIRNLSHLPPAFVSVTIWQLSHLRTATPGWRKPYHVYEHRELMTPSSSVQASSQGFPRQRPSPSHISLVASPPAFFPSVHPSLSTRQRSRRFFSVLPHTLAHPLRVPLRYITSTYRPTCIIPGQNAVSISISKPRSNCHLQHETLFIVEGHQSLSHSPTLYCTFQSPSKVSRLLDMLVKNSPLSP